MSIEKALLKEVLYVIGEYTEDAQERTEILIAEIEKLLAQSEQDNIQYLLDQVARLTAENAMLKEKWSTPKPEQDQEPVAWMQDSIELYVLEEKSVIRGYVIPLYTAPPKRELLGDGITADMYRANKKATHPDSYWAGVYDAEKAHGIGEDDE